MTVIAAIHEQGETWIGSDTQALIAAYRPEITGAKWVSVDDVAVAVAGDLRTLNIIQEHPDRLLGDLSGPFAFVERLRVLLAEFGYDAKPYQDTDRTPNFGGPLLFADKTRVCDICPEFSVVEAVPGSMVARGSGQDYALGVFFALSAARILAGDGPAHVLRQAIAAAIKYDTGCGGEPWIHRLGD